MLNKLSPPSTTLALADRDMSKSVENASIDGMSNSASKWDTESTFESAAVENPRPKAFSRKRFTSMCSTTASSVTGYIMSGKTRQAQKMPQSDTSDWLILVLRDFQLRDCATFQSYMPKDADLSRES